jgi:hypothetical protein
MIITQEVLDALPETGGIGRHLPTLALFSKADDPVDVAGADGRRYMVGWAGGIRYKKALPAYWPIRFGAEHARRGSDAPEWPLARLPSSKPREP